VRDGSQAATRETSDRVKRRLFNLAAAVSLVLCAATAALWARGQWGRYTKLTYYFGRIKRDSSEYWRIKRDSSEY
jgi:hypothetical protein